MPERVFALLVHEHAEPFESLKRALNELSIETCSVATCKEAAEVIFRSRPQIIFTESSLRDGWWSNIMNIADSANVPLNVIVVSAHPDTRLYLSVMERGAFDFVTPPFTGEPLGFVARSAALDAHRRRDSLAHRAAAN